MTDRDSETWLPVVGFAGVYEVSRDGRVRSVDRVVEKIGPAGHVTERLRGVERKPFTRSDGRQQVVLHDAAHRRHCKFVHLLVRDAFADEVAGRPPPTS